MAQNRNKKDVTNILVVSNETNSSFIKKQVTNKITEVKKKEVKSFKILKIIFFGILKIRIKNEISDIAAIKNDKRIKLRKFT